MSVLSFLNDANAQQRHNKDTGYTEAARFVAVGIFKMGLTKTVSRAAESAKFHLDEATIPENQQAILDKRITTIPDTGQIITSFTREHYGPMGRTVYDVAAKIDLVAGFDAEDLLTIGSLGKMPLTCYTKFLDKHELRGARIDVFRDLFRAGDAHAEGIDLMEKAIAQMNEAGAVVVDDLSIGIDLLPLLANTCTNYYEAQFSYNLYSRRLGPDAVIHNVDELMEKGTCS